MLYKDPKCPAEKTVRGPVCMGRQPAATPCSSYQFQGAVKITSNAVKWRNGTRIMSEYAHPGIPRLFFSSELEDGRYFLVMEHAGVSVERLLSHRIRKGISPQLDETRVLRLMLQVVSFLHKKGIAHGRISGPGGDLRHIMVSRRPGSEFIEAIKLTGLGGCQMQKDQQDQQDSAPSHVAFRGCVKGDLEAVAIAIADLCRRQQTGGDKMPGVLLSHLLRKLKSVSCCSCLLFMQRSQVLPIGLHA